MKHKITKARQDALAYLGPDYSLKIIDCELCLYRDLGNGYDIEVSGLRSEKQRGRICNFICVWKWPGPSVEYVWAESFRQNGDGVRSERLMCLADLKRELDRLAEKYNKLTSLRAGAREEKILEAKNT